MAVLMESSKELVNGISRCSVPGRRHLLPFLCRRKRSKWFIFGISVYKLKLDPLFKDACVTEKNSHTPAFSSTFSRKINAQCFPD